MSAALKLPPEAERDLHRRVADMLAAIIGPAGVTNGNGVLWWTLELAEPHEGARIERSRRGAVSGLPDIQIVYRGRLHGIELKRKHGGRPSASQRKLHPELAKAGAPVAVRCSCAEVLASLYGWRIPHRHITLVGAG